MKPAPATRRITEAQAAEALTHALITAAAAGVRPRCGEYGDSYLWLSEDDQDRKRAALLCSGCVVWVECDAVGRFSSFGIYAGRDTTVRAGKRKQRDSEAA